VEKLGHFPNRQEVVPRPTPRDGVVLVGQPRIALVVLLDGGDLGEKLIVDVMGEAVGGNEFGGDEESVHSDAASPGLLRGNSMPNRA